MSKIDLVERLRDGKLTWGDRWAAADRIAALEAERERLALAICGGEDAPGYANAQTVEALEKVANDNAAHGSWLIDRIAALEAQLSARPAHQQLLADALALEEVREALEEIAARHIPDQPAAVGGDEADWCRRQHTELRSIARAALALIKPQSGEFVTQKEPRT